MKSEKMLTWIVIIAILFFAFRHMNRSRSRLPNSVHNVKPYGGWNLYGQSSRKPIPYPHLFDEGPAVPRGASEWLLDGFSVGGQCGKRVNE